MTTDTDTTDDDARRLACEACDWTGTRGGADAADCPECGGDVTPAPHAEDYLGDPAAGFMADIGEARDRLLDRYEEVALLLKHVVDIDCDYGAATVDRPGGSDLRVTASVSAIGGRSPLLSLLKSDLTKSERVGWDGEHFTAEIWIVEPHGVNPPDVIFRPGSDRDRDGGD